MLGTIILHHVIWQFLSPGGRHLVVFRKFRGVPIGAVFDV